MLCASLVWLSDFVVMNHSRLLVCGCLGALMLFLYQLNDSDFIQCHLGGLGVDTVAPSCIRCCALELFSHCGPIAGCEITCNQRVHTTTRT